MALILAILLLALILGGLGFAIHVLWWVGLVVRARRPGSAVPAVPCPAHPQTDP
jgi:hypothetical protein